MSGGFALATVPAAMIAFEAIFILGSVVGLARHGRIIDLEVGILLCVYGWVLLRTGVSHAIRFAEHVVNRIEGERQRDLIGLLLRDFEDNASDWLWEIDDQLRVTHASTRLLTMLGREAEDVTGQNWRAIITPGAQLLPHQARTAHAELARRMLETQTFRDHVIMVHVQNETRWWSITAKPVLDDTGAFRGYRGFGSDITAARRAEQRIEHLTRFDALTGLPNRRQILEDAEKALARLVSRGQSFAVLVVDIDGFRQVNELFGRRNGDDVLIEISERLATCLRDGDVLGRIGGDMFGVIRIGVSTPEDLVFLSKRLNESMSPPFIINGVVASCSITIGIALATPDAADAEALFTRAEQAVENAKVRGPGSYHFAEAELDVRARKSAEFEAELRKAVQWRQIEIAWRPVLDAKTQTARGYHASLRWRHPSLGLLPEEDFLPAAASAGLAGLIGVWKLRRVCRFAAGLSDAIFASVELTQHELEDAGTVLMLSRALEASGLRADRLEIRIREDVLRGGDETVVAAVKGVAQLGVRLAGVIERAEEAAVPFAEDYSISRIVLNSRAIDELGSEGATAVAFARLEALVADGVASQFELAGATSAGCSLVEGPLFGALLTTAELEASLMSQSDAQAAA